MSRPLTARRRRRVRFLPVALALGASACAEEITFPTVPRLTAERPMVQIAPGGTERMWVEVRDGRRDERYRLSADAAPLEVRFDSTALSSGDASDVHLSVPAELSPGLRIPALLAATGQGPQQRAIDTVVVQVVPPFELAASGSFVAQGETVDAVVTARLHPTWRAAWQLAVDSTPPGITLTVDPRPSPTLQRRVAVQVGRDAPVGFVRMRLVGRYGAARVPVEVVMQVLPGGPDPDVALALGSGRLRAVPGGQARDSVFVTRTGGRTDEPVALSLTGAPTGVTARFDPALLPDSRRGSDLTVSAAPGVAAGRYALEVTARLGTRLRTLPVTLEVVQPALAVALSPAALSIPAGQSGGATLTVERTALDDTLEVRVTAPPSVVVQAATTRLVGTSTRLDVRVPAGTPAGRYPVAVLVAGGGVFREAMLEVTVPPPAPPPAPANDYAVTVSADSVVVAAGGSVSLPVALPRRGRWVGVPLRLEARGPAGVDAWLAPSIHAGPSATLWLVASAGAAPGRYPVVVRALAGDTVRADTLSLVVTPAGRDFALLPERTVVTVAGGGSMYTPGTPVSVPILIRRTGGVADPIILTTPDAPSALELTVSPIQASGSVATLSIATGYVPVPGVYVVTIRGFAAGLRRDTQLTVIVP